MACRVVAKVEWHAGELYPQVGFIVTNLVRPAEPIDAFYNQRGTAERTVLDPTPYSRKRRFAVKALRQGAGAPWRLNSRRSAGKRRTINPKLIRAAREYASFALLQTASVG